MAGNIQRRPDGRWRARYSDPNQREHARHLSRRSDAVRWLASQEVAVARGEWIDPALAKITVGEWVQRWYGQQIQLKPSTRVRYDVAIRCQILPAWGNVALSQVSHSDVSAWVQRLSVSGLAPATIRYAHRILSLALSAAVKDGRIVRNVAEGVQLPLIVRRPRRYLSHTQVAALAEALG
jgi:hypothetical protein